MVYLSCPIFFKVLFDHELLETNAFNDFPPKPESIWATMKLERVFKRGRLGKKAKPHHFWAHIVLWLFSYWFNVNFQSRHIHF